VELARHVEQWGYKRYWVAEHHAIQGLACSATPVLIGHIAAATKTIRVGSGGVMLPNHAPLVVAEQFGTLEAIYPGRIDLGLGRAPGGDFQTMRALRRGLVQDGDDFPALLEELRTYLGPERPGQLVKAIPGQNSNVPITLLGSSDYRGIIEAEQTFVLLRNPGRVGEISEAAGTRVFHSLWCRRVRGQNDCRIFATSEIKNENLG
jgi:luciferase family oxidoreductase group 1